MSPSDLEDFLNMTLMLRLTLASGDQVLISADDEPFVLGSTLVLRGERVGQSVTSASRLVSVPNICTLEPLPARPAGGRRPR